MGGVVAKIVFKKGKDELSVKHIASLNDIPVTTIEGTQYERLGELVAGKKFYMVVNVASK